MIDRLDEQLLLCHVLQKPKSFVITHPEFVLSETQLTAFNDLVAQREQGYPLAYLTGVKSFWNMELHVTPDVLIPRPETELLVETALNLLPKNAHVLELATGSGAIACALARERSDLHITASDISESALAIARKNAAAYDLNHIQFIHSNWFENIENTFDMIIANPPYLSETDSHLSTDIRFEPRGALVSGKNGDEDFIQIISQAMDYLQAEGWLLLEHGSTQGERVRGLLSDHAFTEVLTIQDLAKLDRLSLGRFSTRTNNIVNQSSH